MLLLNRLLNEGGEWTHLMWLDADAAVVRQDRRLEELLATAGADAELLVGEDHSAACLLNAGVFRPTAFTNRVHRHHLPVVLSPPRALSLVCFGFRKLCFLSVRFMLWLLLLLRAR